MINHKLRLVFLHVPRTGGLSVIRALEVLAEEKFESPGGFHGRLRDHGDVPLDYRVVMFVRNPWDRIVSLNHFLTGSGRAVPIWNFLDACADNVFQPPYMKLSAHWWHNRRVSWIGKYEHLERDYRDLVHRLGIPTQAVSNVDCPAVLPHLHKTERRLHYAEYYDDDVGAVNPKLEIDGPARLRVAGLCPWELDRLGYTF